MTNTNPTEPLAQPFERRVITVEAWREEGRTRFGPKVRNWRVICPACKTVQTGQDFLDAKLEPDNIRKVFAFSCIGRYRGDMGCDWTLGGLLQIHTLELVMEDGKHLPCFEFAPDAPATQEEGI